MERNMERATYRDNNGFLRYEDNCKLVIQKNYTKEEDTITNEIFNTFKPINRKKIDSSEYDRDYETAILIRQENSGLYDV